MTPQPDRLALSLLLLRVALGIFLLQWAVEKFVVPDTTAAIFQGFYGIAVGTAVAPILGAGQAALALALLFGVLPRISYGLATLLHTATVIVTIPRLLAPWNPVSNHLFIAGVPVLAGFIALYLMRHEDRWTLPRLLAGQGRPVMPR